jgi:hypothetical protein
VDLGSLRSFPFRSLQRKKKDENGERTVNPKIPPWRKVCRQAVIVLMPVISFLFSLFLFLAGNGSKRREEEITGGTTYEDDNTHVTPSLYVQPHVSILDLNHCLFLLFKNARHEGWRLNVRDR